MLHCGHQARFRTFPLFQGNGGNSFCCLQMGQQKGRVQVTLHRANAASTVMPALGERLFHVALAAMAVLRQFGCPCGNFMQGAAGPCNRAFQPVYKHPWGVQSHTFPILLLPRFVRDFFEVNGVALTHDLVGEPTMQTLAMGSQLAFLMSETASGGQVPSTVFPHEALMAMLLDTSLRIVVGWIGGPTLSIELAR